MRLRRHRLRGHAHYHSSKVLTNFSQNPGLRVIHFNRGYSSNLSSELNRNSVFPS